ncbi:MULTISPECIES: peptidylprolyl isomerase [Haloferax]|uniref:peptidylprolyl isomerase n=2 Tax=Haloferax TaxID=2251 RepID=A0A6G1Z6H4_9EURY|nr:peptidylprolyl isomerase [Haloferax sp. CBA1149]MRW82142.1 peptidylprolyl isomerase [Haloferax marinisediminis]
MALRRRSLLALAAAGVGGTLAGCTSSQESTDNEVPIEEPIENEASESTESTRPSGQLIATLRTTKGDIVVELYGDRAPRTVENFVGLATGSKTWVDPQTGESVDGEPLYEDVLFHRVIDDFMIQTGDPTGTGRGGPGYQFDDEFHEELRHDGPGVVSMANAGPDTNGSQFFITLDAQPHLDGRHAVFGQVIEGMGVVEAIGAVETDSADRPVNDVILESVTVETA